MLDLFEMQKKNKFYLPFPFWDLLKIYEIFDLILKVWTYNNNVTATIKITVIMWQEPRISKKVYFT